MGPTQPERQPAEPGAEWSDDQRLAQLARAGDAEAFGKLVEHHHLPIYRLATALLGSGADAEDAAQETFIRACESLRRYDPRRPFAPWLRGIAVKVCQQHQRSRARQARRQAPLSEAGMEPAAGADTEPSPMAQAALEALATLEDSYRLPLTLFYLEQASVGEVAEALGLSAGAVRVRLHRGREKLRQLLSGLDEKRFQNLA